MGSDPHFESKINKKEFSPFLLKEWDTEKKTKLILYNHLGNFTKENIPEIESSDNIIEQETKIDIENLLSVESIATISNAINSYKRAIHMVSKVFEDYKFGSAAVSRVLEDYNKLGSAAMNGLKKMDKEKETFIARRDTEDRDD